LSNSSLCKFSQAAIEFSRGVDKGGFSERASAVHFLFPILLQKISESTSRSFYRSKSKNIVSCLCGRTNQRHCANSSIYLHVFQSFSSFCIHLPQDFGRLLSKVIFFGQ